MRYLFILIGIFVVMGALHHGLGLTGDLILLGGMAALTGYFYVVGALERRRERKLRASRGHGITW